MKTLPAVVLAIGLAGGAQEKATEVVFIGTQHFISDMPAGYTPGHLRALLARINPAVVAVEAPSNVQNPWEFAPLELQWVTKPWAERQKAVLVPIGWNDPFYQLKIQNMLTALQKAGKGEDYQRLESRFQGELSGSTSCEEFNGDKGIDLWRQYHKQLHDAFGKDTPWETWNAKILDNLKPVLRNHRGKRIAVVFGAAHGYYLLDALAKEEGVKVLPCRTFFPIPDKEVSDQTVPKDHLLALRMLNFGGLPPQSMQELMKHLDALKDVKEYRGDYELFNGKALLGKGDAEAALAAFRKVAGLGDGEVSAFDGTTRLNEAGGIYAAIALSRQGKAPEALDQVKSVLQKDNLSAPMKQWAQQLLKEFEPKK